ncbi:MAG TPA: hypothetical protein PKA13_13905 [Geminicoccaceae bacterium]|nr:hypothetical protein [Geminicoccus sp.]HMU50864.1 hypothetical protein [Geminicoccaceae bacterium]
MRIEAFSEGKDLDAPEANEDQLLILPGRGHAVIDGVTDRTGHRYDGMLAGKVAGRTVQAAVAALLVDPPPPDSLAGVLVERASAAIRAAYQRYGILDTARVDRTRRFGATLALAVDYGDAFRFVLIGDSGLRLDGVETIVNDTGLDLVNAGLRQEAYRMVAAAGGSPEDQARVGRACAFEGAAALVPAMRPWLDEAGLGALRRRCIDLARSRLPHVPLADLETLIDGGILRGQPHFQNTGRGPLAYAVLDGFEIPMTAVRVIDRPKAGLASIELFSDGYFEAGAEPSVAAWEAAFVEVERVDPLKIDRYPSVKGTSGRVRADDRTVVVVRL